MPVTTCFIPLRGHGWMNGRQAAKRAILSGWVTQGPEVAAFETSSLPMWDRNACAVSNGTVVLGFAQPVLGRDEVITVSHSSSLRRMLSGTVAQFRLCGHPTGYVQYGPLRRKGNHWPDQSSSLCTSNGLAL